MLSHCTCINVYNNVYNVNMYIGMFMHMIALLDDDYYFLKCECLNNDYRCFNNLEEIWFCSKHTLYY